MTSADGKRLITIQQAAEMLSVHAKTVRRRIDDGTLTGYRFGPRLIRLDSAEVDETARQAGVRP
jgi:excisionase family DNA binding protein